MSLQGICQARPSPRSTVETYCVLDAEGANFDSRNPNFAAIGKLLVNEDESAYDTSIITESFRIGEPSITGTSATVQVTYADIGIVAAGNLRKEVRSERVTFRLTKVNGIWKIDGLRILPHISRDWMLQEYEREHLANQKAHLHDAELIAKIATIHGW